jgi:hypothetical protein
MVLPKNEENEEELLPASGLIQYVQRGTQNDPVSDFILIIQPHNERCFVTW